MITAKKITLLMPAHNEGHHIFNNIKETLSIVSRFSSKLEVIVVDDGSTDNTEDEIKRCQVEFAAHEAEIFSCKLDANAGKGIALKTGFSHATGDIVVFLDSDLDLPPHQIEYLLDTMEKQNADVVVGSKQHPLSLIHYPLRRKILSYLYSKFLHLLFGLPLKDTQTGLKLYRKEVLASVFPFVLSKEFAYDVEILSIAHRWGFKIIEAPVILKFRSLVKWGGISLSVCFKIIWDTLAIFYRLRILKYYDKEKMKAETND